MVVGINLSQQIPMVKIPEQTNVLSDRGIEPGKCDMQVGRSNHWNTSAQLRHQCPWDTSAQSTYLSINIYIYIPQ